jgi:uncharacterized membrane protein YphA (DoxX/SURF4 family)
VFAFLAICAEFLGGPGLIVGFLSRIAALGILFAIGLAVLILIRGGGSPSVDRALSRRRR